MAMKTGYRVFGGKRYGFAMWFDTKKEAKKKAEQFTGRSIFKENKNRALYRITQGVYSAGPQKGKTRYYIWVRVEKLKKSSRR